MQGVGVTEGDLITPQGEGAAAMLQGSFRGSTSVRRRCRTVCAGPPSGPPPRTCRPALRASGTALRDLPTLRARLADMSVRTEQARRSSIGPLPARAGAAEAPLFVLLTRLASMRRPSG